MNLNRLLLIIGLGTFFTAALYFMTGKSPYPAIGIGAVAALLVFILWNLSKRLKASSRVESPPKPDRTMGRSSSPKLDAFGKQVMEAKKGKRKTKKKTR